MPERTERREIIGAGYNSGYKGGNNKGYGEGPLPKGPGRTSIVYAPIGTN